MTFKIFLHFALCFTIGIFIGYQLAFSPDLSPTGLSKKFKEIEKEDISKLDQMNDENKKLELLAQIHEKVFSILLADVAVNLDTRSWLRLLQEEKRLGFCAPQTATVTNSPEANPVVPPSSSPNEVVVSSVEQESVLQSFERETEVKEELKNDKGAFIKDGKILRPTSFFMKTKPLDHFSKLMQQIKGVHNYRFSHLKNPSTIYKLKINSQLIFSETEKNFSGKSEIELRDEKNRVLSMVRSSKVNKFFLYNPAASNLLVILTSPTSFFELQNQGEDEELVGHLYMQRDLDKKYYLWGTLVK